MSHEGSKGRTFLEFSRGLTMSFVIDVKMGSDYERQGFEHTKIKVSLPLKP